MKWIERILTFWIHDSNDFFRNNIRNRMMIRDDDIDSEQWGMFDGSYISRTTINRDNECDSFFLEFIEKIVLQTITIMNPMRKTIRDKTSNLCKKFYENSSTWYSIHIIVTEYHNSLFFFSCHENSIDCFFHIWHEIRIMEIWYLWMKKSFLVFFFYISIFQEYCIDVWVIFWENIDHVSTIGLHVFWLYYVLDYTRDRSEINFYFLFHSYMRSSLFIVSLLLVLSACTLPWSKTESPKPVTYPTTQSGSPAVQYCIKNGWQISYEKNPMIPTMDLVYCTPAWGQKVDAWKYMGEATTQSEKIVGTGSEI